MTVTDTLPAGLTPTAASGTGWHTHINGSTVTATRSDALASGGSYPALTITVSVAANAPASVTNTATVSGGGETNTANDSASDLTAITQVADLTIAKSHTTSFQQGDTADQYTITVNNVGGGADERHGHCDRYAACRSDADRGQRHGLADEHLRFDRHRHAKRRAGRRCKLSRSDHHR